MFRCLVRCLVCLPATISSRLASSSSPTTGRNNFAGKWPPIYRRPTSRRGTVCRRREERNSRGLSPRDARVIVQRVSNACNCVCEHSCKVGNKINGSVFKYLTGAPPPPLECVRNSYIAPQNIPTAVLSVQLQTKAFCFFFAMTPIITYTYSTACLSKSKEK